MEGVIQVIRDLTNPNSTPLRRPTAKHCEISPAILQEVQWTTARCNRLLRPLSSRIALLKKHNLPHTIIPKHYPADITAVDTRGNTEQVGSWKVGAEADLRLTRREQDPDWDPDEHPRKRLRRTYTTKRSTTAARRVEPRIFRGDGLQDPARIPSPLMGRVSTIVTETEEGIGASHLDEKPGVERSSKLEKPQSRDSFRRLAKSITPTQWMLFDGLYSGLDRLLEATAKTNTSPRKGAASLFSMCLRKVPHYIIEEQALVVKEDPDYADDIPTAIYDDLESFGTTSTQGWKPLREVSRAHGILMLGNAIRNGTIAPSIARGLILLCLQAHAFPEAESLLSSTLSTMQPLGRPTFFLQHLFSSQTSIPLQTLKDVATQSGRWSFFFISLSMLLRNRIIPIEWIVCQDMESCLGEVVKAIVQGSSFAPDASELLRTIISISYQNYWKDYSSAVHSYRLGHHHGVYESNSSQTNSMQNPRVQGNSIALRQGEDKIPLATTNTILQLITIITSANNDNSEHEVSGTKTVPETTPSLCFLQSLVRDLLQYHEVAGSKTDATRHDQENIIRSCLPALAVVLLPISNLTLPKISNTSPASQLKLFLNASTEQRIIDALGIFLCAIANCSSRMKLQPGFTYMQVLTARLLAVPASVIDTVTASRIAISAAFEFAENSSQKSHLDWALEMEDLINRDLATAISPRTHGSRTASRNSTKTTTSVGFRWEEAIGEWVSKTPAPRKPQAKPEHNKALSRQQGSAPQRAHNSPSQDSPTSTEESDLEDGETPLQSRGSQKALLSEVSPLVPKKQFPVPDKLSTVHNRSLLGRPRSKLLRFSDHVNIFDDSDASSSDYDASDGNDADDKSGPFFELGEPKSATRQNRSKVSSRKRNTEVEIRVPKLLWPREDREKSEDTRVEVRVPLPAYRRFEKAENDDRVEIRVPKRDRLTDITNHKRRSDDMVGCRKEWRDRAGPVGNSGGRKRSEIGEMGALDREWSEDELGC